ncbi:MAG: hypothetical protein ACLPY1_06195 [Terracidiphilus sp.]
MKASSLRESGKLVGGSGEVCEGREALTTAGLETGATILGDL